MHLEETKPRPRIFVLPLGFFSACCSVAASKHSGSFAALMLNAFSLKKRKGGVQLNLSIFF